MRYNKNNTVQSDGFLTTSKIIYKTYTMGYLPVTMVIVYIKRILY